VIFAGLAMGLVLTAAAGVGPVAWLARDKGLTRTEFAAWVLLAGPLVLSLILFGLGAVLQGRGLVSGVGTLALASAAAGFRLRPRLDPRPPGLSAIGLACMLAALGIVAWQCFARPMGTDGLFNFEFRARVAFAAGGHFPAALYAGPNPQPWHPAYPPGLSLTELWLYLCMGTPHQLWVKTLGIWWFASVLLLIAARLPQRCAWTVTLLLVTPGIVFAPGGPVWLWADFPLAAWLLAAVLAAQRRHHGLLALALCGLVWTKQEGVLLGIAVWAVAFRRSDWKQLARTACPSVGLVLTWKAFLIFHGLGPDTEYDATPRLAQFADRIPTLALLTVREWLTPERWGLLWIAMVPAALRIERTTELAHWRPAVRLIPAMALVYSGVFLLSTWPDYRIHFTSAYPRLLIPLGLVATVAVAAALPVRFRRRPEGAPSVTVPSA